MPDARSPIRHHLVLYRRDPVYGRTRIFSLMIERDLFGTIRLDIDLAMIVTVPRNFGSVPMLFARIRRARADRLAFGETDVNPCRFPFAFLSEEISTPRSPPEDIF